MVKRDIGNQRKNWMNDIGAIESSSKSYFNHSYIHFLLFEILKGKSSDNFKERRVERFEKIFFFLNKINNALL